MAIAGNAFEKTYITTQTTTAVFAGTGVLNAITINGPTATGTITLQDGSTTFAVITVPASPLPVTLYYNALCQNGLNVVTGTANNNITVTWLNL